MHFSHPLQTTKKDNFVTITEMTPSVNDMEPQQKSRPQRSFGSYIRGFIWRFFPWIGEPPPQQLDNLHKQPSFPWLGLLCLLTALSTLGFSLLVFKLINGIPQVENKYLKPASWLSAIISVNSIVLHIALAEGVTTAWWYKASRTDVTLRELHEIYTMGTSTMSVLLAGKRFNYVAMGTIFVATVPLNGFLLQNAITMESSTLAEGAELKLPLVQRLPLGFSANMKKNQLGVWSDELSSATNSLDGLTKLPPGAYYTADTNFTALGCDNKNHTAICKGNATMVGFNMTCTTQWGASYDLLPSSHGGNDSTYSATVYSSKVNWNSSTPNLIGLDIMYKPNQTCQGRFERKTCQFRAALVKFPIQIGSDAGFYAGTEYASSDSAFPVVTLQMYPAKSNFTVLEELPVYDNEGQKNSTYGGIAAWLASRFDGSIEWSYENGTWSVNNSGPLTRSYSLLDYIVPADLNYSSKLQPFTPPHNNDSWCRNVYSGQEWENDIYASEPDQILNSASATPVQEVFYTLHQLMLGASVGQAASWWEDASEKYSDATDQWFANYTASNGTFSEPYPDSVQEFYQRQFGNDGYITIKNATSEQPCLRYRIKYPYWAASVAITVGIVLMVTPLFYGFWTLDRRGTLSPFETASAFGAPALQDADMKKGTGVLLKEIGKRPVMNRASTIPASSLSPPSQHSTDPIVR